MMIGSTGMRNRRADDRLVYSCIFIRRREQA